MPQRTYFLCLLFASAVLGRAQPAPQRLVEFTVVALDGKGKPVTDLGRNEFSIVEDGQPRDTSFFRFEGEPEPAPAPCIPGLFTNRSGCTPGSPENAVATAGDASLPGLEALARHLASVPGRKSIVWAGAPDGSDAEIRAAAQRLATLGVAVYPVNGAAGATDLAAITGGRVVESAARGAEIAANDVRGAYTVGFYVREDPAGRWHDVAVGVERHGVKLTYREGYRPETPADRDWSDEQWSEAMSESLTSATLPVDARCELTPGKDAPTLTCKLLVPDTYLGFLPADGQLRAELETALIEKASDDRFQMQQSRVNVRVSAALAEDLASRATQYTSKWKIGSEISKVRLIVRDRLTSRYATLDLPVASIPPPRTESEETAPAPLPPDADPFIGKAREAALSFLNTLPNYVVRQDTTREAQMPRTGLWAPKDRISVEVVYDAGKESVRDPSLNGKPATVRTIEETGTWSTGQFAGTLKALFEAQSKTVFRERGKAKAGGREARVYDFEVQKANSGWVLSENGRTYVTAYRGAIWLDPETARTLRLEMKARGIPNDFPLDRAESSTEFGKVHIGGMEYLLPSNSMAMACTRAQSQPTVGRRGGSVASDDCARNVIHFSGYRQFGVESNISFGPGR